MKVLFLVARGMHLGYLGCYGNDWVQTPALDRLAAESIVFDQHFATDVTFEPVSTPHLRAAWRWDHWATKLQEKGIQTHLLTDREIPAEVLNKLPGSGDWLLQMELETLLPPWPSISVSQDTEPEARSSKLEVQNSSAKLALQDSYEEVVARLDVEISEIRGALEDIGLLDDVCWILTSDQGQPVDEERERVPPPPWLHEEWIHIPLIIRLPAQAQAGRRVAALTQSSDLLLTLLDFQGLSHPPSQSGSLRPLLEGSQTDPRKQVVAVSSPGGISSWAVRSADCSILLRLGSEPFDPGRDARVYIKPEDRWEVNNVCQHHLDLVDETRQFIEEKIATDSDSLSG